MGVIWAASAVEVIVWGAFFALLGLVMAVLCVVAWAAALRELAAPRTVLHDHAPQFRLLCVAVILAAALIGAYRALTVPLAGL